MDVTTLADRPWAPFEDVLVASWPDWMFQGDAADLFGVARRFPAHQVLVFDDERLVAVGNSVPLVELPEVLPQGGWDWAIASAAEGTARCALAVSVLPAWRGRGLSSRVLKAFGPTIVPVRPNAVPPGGHFAAHVEARRSDGLPVDPWLRTHVRLGGRVDGICWRSMTVRGTPEQWSRWDRSSLLAPVDADGVYVEPNVWVRHG